MILGCAQNERALAAPTCIARREVRQAAESSIYDGSDFCGAIKERNRKFLAYTAAGRKIGEFDDARSGMRAVTAAARTERALDSAANGSPKNTSPAKPSCSPSPRRRRSPETAAGDRNFGAAGAFDWRPGERVDGPPRPTEAPLAEAPGVPAPRTIHPPIPYRAAPTRRPLARSSRKK